MLAAAVLAGCGQNGNQSGEGKSCCGNCEKHVSTAGKADKLVLGNIITMDPHMMRAEAMTIKNGRVQYVGSAELAKALCDENTEVVDYGTNTVYPGFIDVHTHPATAGERLSEQINLVDGETVDDYLETVRQFIAAHPDKNRYTGAGWSPKDRELLATDLDAICADKPIILHSIDGHSFWINTKAMQLVEIDKKAAEEDGPARIHVDAEGNPTGVITEENERMAQHIQPDCSEVMEQLLKWQEFAFGLGLTAVGDAGFGSTVTLDAYSNLEKEGKLKLRTYCSFFNPVAGQPVDEKISQAVALREKYTSEHLRIPGIKLFIDGVVEGHTAWMIDEYRDQPGYHGVMKETDHEYVTNMVKAANENGFYMHMHTIGDGAVKFAVDAIEDAQKQTGLYDARNCMAHLQIVRPEDVKRMGENHITAIVAPLWTPIEPGVSDLEEKYIGKELCWNAYPIRSFLEAGAVIAFHTDYPVSTYASMPGSVIDAVIRRVAGGVARNPEKESITRLDAMKAMTVDAAYALKEDNMGMLSIGKYASYAVFDADFLSDSFEKLFNSQLIATAVDGEVVWSK
jgi:Predicted metal-dependent hydrolase with the TIM-barrel fold